MGEHRRDMASLRLIWDALHGQVARVRVTRAPGRGALDASGRPGLVCCRRLATPAH